MKVMSAIALVLWSVGAEAQTDPAGAARPSSSPGTSRVDGAAAPAREAHPWHVGFSVMNTFDGNVNHDVVPIRSYGLTPAVALRYESSERPGFVWGYDVALNSYTGTDEWDRVSHGIYTALTHRIGGRLRLETGGAATWRGSSEDRELSNEFGVSERLVVKVSDTTRLVLLGAYRYKQYPDDPGTSGPSPYAGGKFDWRVAGSRRLTFGYKFQIRDSQARRDRYRRHAYSLDFSTPLAVRGDALSMEFEYRPQRYDRLIKVDGGLVARQDRRVTLAATYERPLGARVNVVWHGGVESRDSNDPDKRYLAPALTMTLRYRWR